MFNPKETIMIFSICIIF